MHHERLQQLRHTLEKQGVDGYLVPSVDPYLNEYPPACYRRLEWLTGFTGSAGVALILKDSAAFFTDGRYTLQAKSEVSTTDYVHIASGAQQPWQWLSGNSAVIGYDPMLYSKEQIDRYPHTKAIDGNLIDALWTDRPSSPSSRIQSHGIVYAGQSTEEKIVLLQAAIEKKQVDALLLTDPSSICWLLNMRGRDVPHTPLILGYAIVYSDGNIEWFVENKRQGDTLPKSVVLYPLELLQKRLEQLTSASVLVDSTAPVWFSSRLHKKIWAENPCLLPKSCKNPIEINGMRAAHKRDGAALTKLLYWLDTHSDLSTLTECDVAKKLLEFRSANEWFMMPSFDTIAGHGSNGAIVHYRANEHSNRFLTPNTLLLLDSGGQYLDGTTDVTRTIPIGEPTSEQKDRFTRVLKGHIALARLIFPKGTTGSAIDAIARQYLWEVQLDYEHGTGHGVGSFLGVHEGPQRISKVSSTIPLQPGMILSNEPGYYKEGSYGIRIENLVVVVDKGDDFYGFETLTMVPIDRRLIDFSLMTESETEWLETYHDQVTSALSGFLNKEERLWLMQRLA